LKAYLASVDTDDRAYMTMYISYPEKATQGRSPAVMLDGARDGAVANVKGKLRKEEKLTLGSAVARQIIIDAPNNVVLVSRFLMLEKTLVQVLVAGPPNIENEPDTKRFLGSLKLVFR